MNSMISDREAYDQYAALIMRRIGDLKMNLKSVDLTNLVNHNASGG